VSGSHRPPVASEETRDYFATRVRSDPRRDPHDASVRPLNRGLDRTTIPVLHASSVVSLARPVVPLSLLHKTLLVRRCELRPIDRESDLVDLACEREPHLVVLVVNRRPCVRADVEVLVPGEDQWNRVVHLLLGDALAVDLEHAGAALADAAHV